MISLILFCLIQSVLSNPLVPHVGMADPHVHVFNGTLYMYSTHDLIEQGAKGCCTGDWWIWTAPFPDGPWRNVTSLADPAWTPPGLMHQNWATDAAERGGKYYWYVSIGGNQVAVFESPSPIGPWKEPLGHFLLEGGKNFNPPTNIRDPGVLQDDDGRYFIVYGACSGPRQPDDGCYYISELNSDMISTQPPVHISIKGAFGHFGHGKADDKPFLHKRENVYYLSWGPFYATSETVFGPYQYRGCIIDPERGVVEQSFLIGNATEEASKLWFQRGIYRDRHGSYVKHLGQWYTYFNDYSHSDKPNSGFRDTVAAYIHYNDDGSMAPIELTEHGVQPHDLIKNPIIRAENYFHLEGGKKKNGGSTSGFVVEELNEHSILTYRVKEVTPEIESPTITLSNGTPCTDGVVSIYSNNQELWRCPILSTGAWNMFSDFKCVVTSASKVGTDVELSFQMEGCGGENFVRLDQINFSSASIV
eukprot:g4046.t1